MEEKILDILEKHYHGRNFIEKRCAKELLALLDVSVSLTDSDEEYEPYFGWCNVEGCENEGANGGCCWRETGYWTVCSKHASEYRAGKPQPKMQQKYIDKEATRLPDGTLPIVNEG